MGSFNVVWGDVYTLLKYSSLNIYLSGLFGFCFVFSFWEMLLFLLRKELYAISSQQIQHHEIIYVMFRL